MFRTDFLQKKKQNLTKATATNALNRKHSMLTVVCKGGSDDGPRVGDRTDEHGRSIASFYRMRLSCVVV